MSFLQEVFNNRELAMGIWLLLVAIVLIFVQPVRRFLREAFDILFTRKFVVFYFIFIFFLLIVIWALKEMGIWNIDLLKDTIFWVIFVEIPIFSKTVQRAKDIQFFKSLLKDNFGFVVVLEFYLNFWTLEFWLEFCLVPLIVLTSMIYTICQDKPKMVAVRSFFEFFFGLGFVALFIYAVYNTIIHPESFLNFSVLKSFLLPVILLVLNLPVIYGLALFCRYEEILLYLKDFPKDRYKIMLRIFRFSGFNLYKTSALRKIKPKIIIDKNLDSKSFDLYIKQLEKQLSLQIGANYMKRINFYLIALVLILFSCVSTIVFLNYERILQIFHSANFSSVNPTLTQVLILVFVLCLFLIVFVLGMKKKHYEELSQIKKFALFELVSAVKHQKLKLQDNIDVNDPVSIYNLYFVNAYEIWNLSNKVLMNYENLLKDFERDFLLNLQMYSYAIVNSVVNIGEDSTIPNINVFVELYKQKVKKAKQNEKFNSFTSFFEQDVKKYCKQIDIVFDEFKNICK